MFVDSYEIHIQAFVDFINAFAIIYKSSSSENMIQNEVRTNCVQRFRQNENKSMFRLSDMKNNMC